MRMSIVQAVLASVVLATGCGTPAAPSALTSATRTGASTPSAGSQSPTNSQPERSVPFKGRLDGTVTATPLQPPLAQVLIVAEGNATHLGSFHLEVPHLVSFATATGEGTYTFTAANGDILTAHFTGTADTIPRFSRSSSMRRSPAGRGGSRTRPAASACTARTTRLQPRPPGRSTERSRFSVRRHRALTHRPGGGVRIARQTTSASGMESNQRGGTEPAKTSASLLQQSVTRVSRTGKVSTSSASLLSRTDAGPPDMVAGRRS